MHREACDISGISAALVGFSARHTDAALGSIRP